MPSYGVARISTDCEQPTAQGAHLGVAERRVLGRIFLERLVLRIREDYGRAFSLQKA